MSGIIEELKKHEKFSNFIVPIDDKVEFRDATYFLREDGKFIFAEAYCHTPDRPLMERSVFSHIVFVPREGDAPDYTKKLLFGKPYINITKEIMNTQPLNLFYPLQLKKYLELDPSLDVEKPLWARYKVPIAVKSLVGCFPHRHSLKAIFARGEGGDESARRIKRAVESSADMLGISPEQFGISGSLSLGTYENPHDLDVVIYARVKEVRRIVDFLYKLTKKEERRRVFEFGKFWPIRYWEHVDGEKLMFCPFFSYLDLDECPLRDFTCERIAPVAFEGRVADHTHNAYNPTVLMLDGVKMDGRSRQDEIRLILYHGGERGDYVEGDRVAGRGTHVLIRTFRGSGPARHKTDEFEAVLTTSIGDVNKLAR